MPVRGTGIRDIAEIEKISIKIPADLAYTDYDMEG
jgi:hypothetical protein